MPSIIRSDPFQLQQSTPTEQSPKRFLPAHFDRACVAASVQPHICCSPLINQNIDFQQSCIRVPEQSPGSFSAADSNGDCTPGMAKEVFSIPISPATCASVRARDVQSSTSVAAAARSLDTKLHSSHKAFRRQVPQCCFVSLHLFHSCTSLRNRLHSGTAIRRPGLSFRLHRCFFVSLPPLPPLFAFLLNRQILEFTSISENGV